MDRLTGASGVVAGRRADTGTAVATGGNDRVAWTVGGASCVPTFFPFGRVMLRVIGHSVL